MSCNQNSVFGIGTFGGCNCGGNSIRLLENGCGAVDVEFVNCCNCCCKRNCSGSGTRSGGSTCSCGCCQ